MTVEEIGRGVKPDDLFAAMANALLGDPCVNLGQLDKAIAPFDAVSLTGTGDAWQALPLLSRLSRLDAAERAKASPGNDWPLRTFLDAQLGRPSTAQARQPKG